MSSQFLDLGWSLLFRGDEIGIFLSCLTSQLFIVGWGQIDKVAGVHFCYGCDLNSDRLVLDVKGDCIPCLDPIEIGQVFCQNRSLIGQIDFVSASFLQLNEVYQLFWLRNHEVDTDGFIQTCWLFCQSA